mgnify:FL=1
MKMVWFVYDAKNSVEVDYTLTIAYYTSTSFPVVSWFALTFKYRVIQVFRIYIHRNTCSNVLLFNWSIIDVRSTLCTPCWPCRVNYWMISFKIIIRYITIVTKWCTYMYIVMYLASSWGNAVFLKKECDCSEILRQHNS